jgi:hypothetical protein
MKLIEKSEKLIKWIDDLIDGVEISSNDRSRIVAGCFDIVLENQKSIILLIKQKLYGSAFSLVRVQFEAYVRGLWLQHCAKDVDIENFKKDKLSKTFASMIEEIEKVDGYKDGVISKAKNAGWTPMNSFTHTGFRQVVRRNTESFIEPDYGVAEIDEVIKFANAWRVSGILCKRQC